MTLYRCLFIFLFYSVTSNCTSQNLVINPGFEDTLGCPDGPFQVNKCVGWKAYVNTPDYYNRCGKIDEGFGVPENWEGRQDVVWGNAYVGLFTYYNVSGSKNVREAIGSELQSPLEIGKQYYVSMKVSLAEYTGYASNNIGMTFSTLPLKYNQQTSMIYINRAFFYESNVIKDSTNWVKIKGSFVADSNYKYVVLGNFFTDSLTSHELINSKHFDLAYYYIDDICISEDSLTCHNTVGVNGLNKSQLIKVYPDPFNGFLNIQSKDGSQLKVSIFSPSSGIVYQGFCESEPIDLRQLPAGIYFYVIQDIDGHQYTGKVVKN